jgi:thiol:disulfide interchange protein
MELTTFRAQEVKQRLAGYVVVKFKAEDLTDKGTRAVADRFGVKGLPTYVVLKPGSAPP